MDVKVKENTLEQILKGLELTDIQSKSEFVKVAIHNYIKNHQS